MKKDSHCCYRKIGIRTAALTCLVGALATSVIKQETLRADYHTRARTFARVCLALLSRPGVLFELIRTVYERPCNQAIFRSDCSRCADETMASWPGNWILARVSSLTSIAFSSRKQHSLSSFHLDVWTSFCSSNTLALPAHIRSQWDEHSSTSQVSFFFSRCLILPSDVSLHRWTSEASEANCSLLNEDVSQHPAVSLISFSSGGEMCSAKED